MTTAKKVRITHLGAEILALTALALRYDSYGDQRDRETTKLRASDGRFSLRGIMCDVSGFGWWAEHDGEHYYAIDARVTGRPSPFALPDEIARPTKIDELNLTVDEVEAALGKDLNELRLIGDEFTIPAYGAVLSDLEMADLLVYAASTHSDWEG